MVSSYTLLRTKSKDAFNTMEYINVHLSEVDNVHDLKKPHISSSLCCRTIAKGVPRSNTGLRWNHGGMCMRAAGLPRPVL